MWSRVFYRPAQIFKFIKDYCINSSAFNLTQFEFWFEMFNFDSYFYPNLSHSSIVCKLRYNCSAFNLTPSELVHLPTAFASTNCTVYKLWKPHMVHTVRTQDPQSQKWPSHKVQQRMYGSRLRYRQPPTMVSISLRQMHFILHLKLT